MVQSRRQLRQPRFRRRGLRGTSGNKQQGPSDPGRFPPGLAELGMNRGMLGERELNPERKDFLGSVFEGLGRGVHHPGPAYPGRPSCVCGSLPSREAVNRPRSNLGSADRTALPPVPLGFSGLLPYGLLLLLLLESFNFAYKVAGFWACGTLPGSEPPFPVPPACQKTRRAFPVSGRGLCPRPLVLAKLNVADVEDLDFFPLHCKLQIL